MNRTRHVALLVALVFFLAVLPFARTTRYDLVNLDDFQYTVARAHLTDAPLQQAFSWLLTSYDDGIWMPVTRLTYLLDCRLRNENPQAFHTTNVVFHGLNAVLLFLLLLTMARRDVSAAPQMGHDGGASRRFAPPLDERVGRGVPAAPLFAAAVAALFWAMHPLRVESVAWVASRKDVVSLFFELLALIFWITRLDHNQGALRGGRLVWASLACFALAGMSKPSAMTFPVLAALLEWLKGRGQAEIRWGDYAAPAVMACVIGAVAQYTQRAGGATVALADVPLHGRLLNAVAAFGIYCWKTMWPTDLAVQCVHRWPAMPRFWAQGLAICAGYGLALCWCGWRSGVWKVGRGILAAPPSTPDGGAPGRFALPADSLQAAHRDSDLYSVIFVGLAWFLVAVGPTLGVSNFGIHAFADRFTYLPAIGFSVLMAGFLVQADSNRMLWWLATGVSSVVLCFGVMASRQTRYWRDEGTLFEHTLVVDGEDNALIRGMLGLHYYEFDGDLAKARAHMDYAFARVRARELESIRGVYIEVLAESGDIKRAKEEIRRYLEIRECDARQFREQWERQHGTALTDKMGYLVHAIVNLAEGNLDIAKSHVDTFDQLLPGVAHTSYLRGKIALAEGDTVGAIRHLRRSVSDTRAYIRHRFVEKRILELDGDVRSQTSRPNETSCPTSLAPAQVGRGVLTAPQTNNVAQRPDETSGTTGSHPTSIGHRVLNAPDAGVPPRD